VENKTVSSLVVSLGKTLNGMSLPLSGLTVSYKCSGGIVEKIRCRIFILIEYRVRAPRRIDLSCAFDLQCDAEKNYRLFKQIYIIKLPKKLETVI